MNTAVCIEQTVDCRSAGKRYCGCMACQHGIHNVWSVASCIVFGIKFRDVPL